MNPPLKPGGKFSALEANDTPFFDPAPEGMPNRRLGRRGGPQTQERPETVSGSGPPWEGDIGYVNRKWPVHE